MNPLPRHAALGGIRVAEKVGSSPPGSIRTLVLDQDVGIDSRLLQDYCLVQPTAFTYDLMTVVAAVRSADREVRRIPSEGWARHLTVELPVYDHVLWRSAHTQALLRETLSYLTGDQWEFTFKARRSKFRPPQQTFLAIRPDVKTRFLPYSHGLDSYAQLRLLQHRDKDTLHVCVYADTRQMSGGWKEFCRRTRGQSVRPIRVPLRFSDPHHSERTFRTRPFIYYILSAYGAMTVNASEVVVPENGQGSLGGSLALLGCEAPHRSCHPGFTTRLTQLFRQLTGHTVVFQHPGLFSTKADVLTDLLRIDQNGSKWMAEHWSCSHDQRNSSHGRKRIHCGVCGNCILRRNAAFVAGIVETTPYLYSNLQSPTMHSALLDDSPQPRSYRAFEDLASNGVRGMQRLADMAERPDDLAVWSEAASIAESQGATVEQTRKELLHFMQTHATQWRDFLTHCGPDSWVTTMARG